jgi:hypothetical protein
LSPPATAPGAATASSANRSAPAPPSRTSSPAARRWSRVTARPQALHDLCSQRGITAPILGEVHAILYQGKKPMDALMSLMNRELKRETHSPFPRK